MVNRIFPLNTLKHIDKSSVPLRVLLVYAIFSLIITTSHASAQEMVRAKIGIQVVAGENSKRAKTTNRIKAGQRLRIYVIPEEDAYVYVVHTDRKTVTLLNQSKVSKNSQLMLPSSDKYFFPDGLSNIEAFTVICSPNELENVLAFFSSNNTSHAGWSELEKGLLEKSTIDLGETSDKPFAMAGNVRGMDEKKLKASPIWFPKTLPLFSGKSFIVKKFRFNVKK